MNVHSLLQEGRAVTLSIVGPFLAGAAGVGLLWQLTSLGTVARNSPLPRSDSGCYVMML